MKLFKNYINGEYIEALSGEKSIVYNPATGEPVFEVPQCGKEELDYAVNAAAAVQKKWRTTSVIQRGNLLRKLARELEDAVDTLAPILSQEQGKTLLQAKAEIKSAAGMIDYHANWDRRLEGEILPGNDNIKENVFVYNAPLGVVACILPWNYPINILCRKIAPALLAGNTVVCKPSSDTPVATLAFAELIEKAGFPAGVVNFITGRGSVIGNAIASNPKVNMITVTGSTETGQEIIRLSADNIVKVSLELGGKAPAVVMEDADLELAADCVVNSRLGNAGQICTCVERCYVHESIANKFIRMLKERMEAVTYGDGMKNPELTMGAMINKKATERVQGMVDRAVEEGARVITGGFLPDGPGAFYPPTLLIGAEQDSEIVQEEVFGPVLPVLTFRTVEEALNLVNDCQYGLTSSLYTENYQTIMLFANNVEYGELYVNRKHGGEAWQGFHQGWKKSGIGGDDGWHGLQEFMQKRTVYMDFRTDLY